MWTLRNWSERCQRILDLLMHASNYISLKEIAQKVGVSRRSVYYDICSINDCLDSCKLPSLKIVRGKGIFLSEVDKTKIRDFDETTINGAGYIFLPDERVKIIVCYIIHSKTPIYVEQLMEACQVSRNTIFNDLHILLQQLHEYNLSLSYAPKTGYKIEGDVVHVRSLYFLFFDAIRPLLDNGMLSFFNSKEIYDYYDRLLKVTTQLHMNYVEGNLFSIAALLPIMSSSTDELYFPGLKEKKIFVLNHSLVQSCWQGGLADRLFETVKAYVDIANHDALKRDILNCLQGSQFANELEENQHKGILDFLTEEKIVIIDESMNWMDAVYFAGETLIRDGSILEKYLDAIISQTTYYGTYMFINSEIMLAHAKPQDGVNCLDLSLTIFKKTVFFAENRNAKMILMLSAEDNERHLGIMNDIWKMAQNEKGIVDLANADTPNDIIKILKDLLT